MQTHIREQQLIPLILNSTNLYHLSKLLSFFRDDDKQEDFSFIVNTNKIALVQFRFFDFLFP